MAVPEARHGSAGAGRTSGGGGGHFGAPHVNEPGRIGAPHVNDHALVLEGVTRSFGALRAIEDISFSVAAGERRAVIGANGAGKTTLFNVITGDFPATAGRVLISGEDVSAHAPFERIRRELRRTYH